MKLLFDTHAFIWWVSSPAKLSSHALALCNDPTNNLLFSVVSAWEIQIKSQAGKLQLNIPLVDIITNQLSNHVEILPVNLEHVLTLDTLPLYHKDPFDRLLMAQANIENAALISHDKILDQYPVKIEW